MSREAPTGAADGRLPPLLLVSGLAKRFGGFYALDGLSFHVAAGEIIGLVGPNGSGKTTCINVLTGLHRPDGGKLTFQGRSVGGMAPHRLARLGINRTFQQPKPFLSLRVRENVELAATYGRGAGATSPGVDEVLVALELDRDAQRRADELNSVQQKLLDLARALVTGPRLLCIDELAAGLSPSALHRMADRLRALAQSGVALIVVEHLMGFIDRVTDRVIVLNAGKAIFEGSLSAAVKDPQVIEVYLGAEHDF